MEKKHRLVINLLLLCLSVMNTDKGGGISGLSSGLAN